MLVKLVENVWDGKKIHKPSVQSPSQKHCRRETSIFHTVEWMEEPQFLAFKTKHKVKIKDDNKKMCVVAACTPYPCHMSYAAQALHENDDFAASNGTC